MNTNIPVKIMRVEDFEKIATPIRKAQVQTLDFSEFVYKSDALELMRRYEKETSQILERKHFVCEVEKPNESFSLTDAKSQTEFAQDLRAYEYVRSQLVFEGFEEDEYGILTQGDYKLTEHHHTEQHNGLLLNDVHMEVIVNLFHATLYDFIYRISKYNETATQKINLKFTETFIKRIVG